MVLLFNIKRRNGLHRFYFHHWNWNISRPLFLGRFSEGGWGVRPICVHLFLNGHNLLTPPFSFLKKLNFPMNISIPTHWKRKCRATLRSLIIFLSLAFPRIPEHLKKSTYLWVQLSDNRSILFQSESDNLIKFDHLNTLKWFNWSQNGLFSDL